MGEKIAVVMDCGATNVRAIAVNEKGELLAKHSIANNTRKLADPPGMVIWDVDEIWNKFVTCTKSVLEKVPKEDIVAVTVTTFGVDGAPVLKTGDLIHPILSWQCELTQPVMEAIDKYIPLPELYKENGLQTMHYNTINKLIWFQENKPEVLDKMDYFVFIPSLFLHKLSGEFTTDASMAGTSMLTSLESRGFSDRILSSIGMTKDQFPNWVEPGEVIGKVTAKASAETGIPEGVRVVATGHDTQYAIFGSGAEEGQPVLSSGTWEILMVRSKGYLATDETLQKGITTEYDPVPGLFNPGVQWIASGALEWVKRNFFAKEAETDAIYDVMIDEAKATPVGANGVCMHPNFFPGTGPSAIYGTQGSILGLTMNSTRGEVYRAMLEALSCQMREAVEILQAAGGFKADSIICVGGGSKNAFWNQMKADVMGIPVRLIEQTETTVLGAALFAFAGVGVYSDAYEARNVISYKGETFEPSNKGAYDKIYAKFQTLAKTLEPVYKK